MSKKQQKSGSVADSPEKASRRTPLWQALLLPVAAILIFFVLLEGGLALFGFHPALQSEDPFVGFAANIPLFVPSTDTSGKEILVTAANKKDYFNRQSFPRKKGENTFRVFCLGGSTTYGRPYGDATSFAGWLRELLPASDRSKTWEVINAGGISYASYRVAHLMEELIRYRPDLFIIYTGHNEFLEERTYRKLREVSPLLKTTVSLLSRTRTWSAMTDVVQSLHLSPSAPEEQRTRLGVEVDTILDQSAGLDRYHRDDPLKENILNHYRVSLERMVTLARSVGARVIFVTPASNLKDCTPFKSQHTDGISAANLQRVQKLAAMSTVMGWQKQWRQVLRFMDEAVALDPRFAEYRYRRGQALLGLGRSGEALKAFRLARDEDVCPLRALTPMRKIVIEVARGQGVPVVDFVKLLAHRMQKEQGQPIPGKEYFLDHVHPTIEGNRVLAVALLEAMASNGMVHPGPGWGREKIAAVAAKIEGGIDREAHGRALANLARVLLWAEKRDDANRLARQALDIAGSDYKDVAINAVSTIATVYLRDGNPKRAVKLLYSYIDKAPDSIELRLKLGQIMLGHYYRNFEKAAANLLLVTRLMPYYDGGHALFGIDMAERGRPRIAYPSLMEALRLNPNNSDARKRFNLIRPSLEGQELRSQPPKILMENYPSTAPRLLVQGYNNAKGSFIRDGIEIEFYDNGRLMRLTDYERGVRDGLEITWDRDGKLLSRTVYRQGEPTSGRTDQ
jgi:tetratricopeptide (TPR) repeat protein